MNKRIRRKKCLGEFKEFCAPIAIKITAGTDMEAFLNDLLTNAIEVNECCLGGGGDDEVFEGFLELGNASDKPEEKLEKVINWIKSRSDVEKLVTGKLTDAWYGPFDELEL